MRQICNFPYFKGYRLSFLTTHNHLSLSDICDINAKKVVLI